MFKNSGWILLVLGYLIASTATSDVVSCLQYYGVQFQSLKQVNRKCISGLCHANVISVADALIEQGIPKSEIKFLLIIPGHLNDQLYPQTHNDKSTKYWNYHVLVQVGHRIFDIDHIGNATPMRVDTYFSKMFGKGNIDFSLIDVRTFSHEQYMASINRYGELAIAYNRYQSIIPTDSLKNVLDNLDLNVRKIQKQKIESNANRELSPIAQRFENMIQIFNGFKSGDPIVFLYELPPNGIAAVYDGIYHSVNLRSVVVIGPKRNLLEIPFETIKADTIGKP